MADTPQEIVAKELREYKRYTGDGQANEPVGAPLPVGDPASGVWNPKKVNLRKAMLETLEGAEAQGDRAEAEADHSEEWAQSDDPISEAAGGDGSTDRSSKWHADRSETAQGLGEAAQAASEAARDLSLDHANDALSSKTQAELAALAAGAPLFTSEPDLGAAPSPYLLQVEAGTQVWEHDGTDATMVGWLGKVEFPTVAALEAFTGPLGPEGTEIEAQGFRYEVAAGDATDYWRETAGGDRLNIAEDVLLPEVFGAMGDWDDETQTGTDDTASIQEAITYCRERGFALHGSGAKYRITGTINTQGNPETQFFAPTTTMGQGSTIIADFDGDVAVLLRGGGSQQIFKGWSIRPSTAYENDGGNDEVSIGLEARNCRYDIDIVVNWFKGDGVVFTTEAGNSNACSHVVVSNNNGRGVKFQGTSDNMSVTTSNIRARGNQQEGIFATDDCQARDFQCFWYAENNWLSDISAANYGVNIGRWRSSDIWIYAEQANAANEIFFGDNTSSNRVHSARRNKDRIIGDNQMWNGKTVSQISSPSPGENRQATPLRINGANSRPTSSSDSVRLPFTTGALETGGYGGIKGQADGMQLYDLSGREVGLYPDHVALAETRRASGRVELTEGEASRSFTLLTSSQLVSRPVVGTLYIVASNSSGARDFIRVAHFCVVGGTVTVGSPAAFSQESPSDSNPAYTLDVVNGALVLTVSYTPTTGQTSRFSFFADLIKGWG